MVWGLWYPLGQDLWDYIAISGAIYSTGAFALLTLGLYWKKASRLGAYLALICGFGSTLGLKPVQNLFGMDFSSAIVGLVVVASAVVMMIIGSLICPHKPQTLNNEN